MASAKRARPNPSTTNQNNVLTTGQHDLKMCNQLNGNTDQNTADEKTVATDTSLHHALGLDRSDRGMVVAGR